MNDIFAYVLAGAAVLIAFIVAAAKKYDVGTHPLEEEPLVAPQTPQEAPGPTPTAELPRITLENFCLAIRDFEGKPGDANYRNNNPLNFRCSPVGYLPIYGHVGCSPASFAVFRDYQTGWQYGLASVHHTATIHPDWTIYQFIAHRAPTTDNNEPKHYAEWVSKQCGVIPTRTLGSLLA